MDFKNIDEGHAQDEQKLHFYYNREERIARAPKNVQDYYAGKGPRPVKGLFRSLFANKGNRFMFSTVAILAAFVWIYSFIQKREGIQIAGTKVEVSAFSYADEVYASLKLNAFQDDAKFNGEKRAVYVKFYAIETSSTICDEKELFGEYDGTETFFRTKFSDYDIIKIQVELSLGDETKEIVVPVEKK